MPDSMPIEFQTRNLNDAIDALKAIGQQAIKTGQQVAGIGKGAGPFSGGPSAKGSGGGTPLQQGRAQAQSQIFAARVLTAQQKQQAQAQLAQIRIQRAQIQLSKAQTPKPPPSFASRASRFIRSSRFGANGLQPLVGAGLDLLGAGEAGPAGLAAAGLFEAAKAAKAFADSASSAANSFARSQQQTGGTPSETGMTRALAQGLGIDPNSVAGSAEGLSSMIDPRSGNPFALAAAQKAGLNITPQQLGGDPDLTHNLTKALDYIHYDKDAKDALQTARNLGMTQYLGVRNLNDKDYEALKRAGVQAGGAQAGNVGAGASYDASKARLDAAASQALAPAQRSVMNAGKALNNNAAQAISDLNSPKVMGNIAASTSDNYGKGGGVYGPAFASAGPRARAAFEAYQRRAAGTPQPGANASGGFTMTTAAGGGAGFSPADFVKAVKEHSHALNNHAKVLQSVNIPGEYGNVTRQGALPSGIGGPALHEALRGDLKTIRLSTF